MSEAEIKAEVERLKAQAVKALEDVRAMKARLVMFEDVLLDNLHGLTNVLNSQQYLQDKAVLARKLAAEAGK